MVINVSPEVFCQAATGSSRTVRGFTVRESAARRGHALWRRTTMSRRTPVRLRGKTIATIALAGLVAAGCGDGGSGTPNAGTTSGSGPSAVAGAGGAGDKTV